MARENYYILLDLDPSERDPVKIEAAISAKQREWSGLRNHPQKGNWANACLMEVLKMRRMVSNPEELRQEAEDAKRLSLQKEKKRFEDLDDALKTISSKGYVSEKELENLLKKPEFKSFMMEDMNERLHVPVKKEAAAEVKDKVQPMETVTAKQIEAHLQTLGKSDLYDFLELKRSSSLMSLQTKVVELYRETGLSSNKDAYFTAKQALIGQCQAIFKEEDSRKRYEKTLDLQRFATLDKKVEYAGVDGEITADEFEHLVMEGTKLGLAKEEVVSRIKELGAQKKWSVQLPGKGSSVEQSLTCGVCGALNAPRSKACGNCGFPVEVNCPKCSTLQPSSARNCNKCGYSICDMPNALPLLREAKDALAEGEFARAESAFQRADSYWQNHPDILSGRQQIKSRSERAQSVLKKAQELLQKGDGYQARLALAEAKALLPDSAQVAALEAAISQKIMAAEKCLAKARAAASTAEREAAFLEALDVCTDCQEAIAGLAKMPPDAPAGLTALVQEQAVLLNWKAVSSKAQITYRVVRKIGALPSHPTDGEVLSDTPQLSYLDKTGQPGLPCHYAVFAQRGGVFSSKAALSESLTQTANVERLNAVPADGSVTLRWQAPPNALRVEVWTKKGALPERRGDGSQLPSIRSDGASHDGLANDYAQGYLVVAIFKDGMGRELPAKGLGILTAATAPPKPVEHLLANKTDNLVELTWYEGTDKVELYWSDKPFFLQFGEVFPYIRAGTIGTSVPVHQKGLATARLPRHGVYGFLPVTIKGQLAVAGRAVMVAYAEEISDLTGKMEDGKLRLTWKFPPGAQQVQVLCSDKYASNSGNPVIVTEQEYRRSGAWTLDYLPPNAPDVTVRVRTLVEVPGAATEYSAGKQINVKVKKTTLRFSVQKNGLASIFSSTRKFDLRVELDGLLDTKLQLVVKENNRLISFKDPDRTVIREFSAIDFMSSETLRASFTYKPAGKSVQQLFFSIIPLHADGLEMIQVEDNGKRIML